MRIRKLILETVALWGGLLLFLAVLNPEKMPVLVLVIPFVVLFLAIYKLWMLIAWLYKRGEATRPLIPAFFSAVCVVSLALQSIGELTARDFIAVLLLALSGYFYLLKNKKTV